MMIFVRLTTLSVGMDWEKIAIEIYFNTKLFKNFSSRLLTLILICIEKRMTTSQELSNRASEIEKRFALVRGSL